MSIITAKDLRITRWTLSGASASAQGADGVGELARTAYAAMLAAEWEEGGEPSIPVHEYDRARPSGDAYRATYGYDAETRSERSCCGAVCYVLKIPSGANGAPPSIALDVIGDRYVESNIVDDAETGGVCIGAFASDSPTPLAFEAEVAAATDAAEHICVPATVDPQGRTIRPNDREGVTDHVVLEPSGTGAYVHILLRMADYTAFRGAWIEGGALASIDTLAATWEAEVAPDAPAAPELLFMSMPAYWQTASSSDHPTDTYHGYVEAVLCHGYNQKGGTWSAQQIDRGLADWACSVTYPGLSDLGIIFLSQLNSRAASQLLELSGRTFSGGGYASFVDLDNENAQAVDIFGSITCVARNTLLQAGRRATGITFDGTAGFSPSDGLVARIGVWGSSQSILAPGVGGTAPGPYDNTPLLNDMALGDVAGFLFASAESVDLPLAADRPPMHLDRLCAIDVGSGGLPASAPIHFDAPMVLSGFCSLLVVMWPVSYRPTAWTLGKRPNVNCTSLGNIHLVLE